MLELLVRFHGFREGGPPVEESFEYFGNESDNIMVGHIYEEAPPAEKS